MLQLINRLKQKMLPCYLVTLLPGFTLVEILVVATIISLLAGTGLVSYSSFVKNSRDARRKADLEQIRAALEMYRSNVGAYPTTAPGQGLPFGTGSLGDGTNTYLQKIPQDPKSNKNYYYLYSAGDYTLASQLENSSSCNSAPGGDSCGTDYPCNYCLGPYGQK